jgi:UDP-N-acetylglucosamine--N-acetylmuramyl-(pentapeptide) pyrophosphoryl-undecaprenol N-acetylglucosamine transferase
MKRPWFVIAGGGTGGHLYPGLAVAQAIQAAQPDFDVTVFGTQRAIDKKLVSGCGYELVPQSIQPFPSKFWRWPGFLLGWKKSVRVARERFAARRPVVVLGLGGYAAGPPITAAARLGIPTALFNPDAVPGLANRKLAPKVDCVFVQWHESVEHFQKARAVKATGCPIRPEFAHATRKAGSRAFRIDESRPTLLITGASQGAHSINAACMEMFDLWRVASNWQIVHLTGETDLEMCRTRYSEAGIDAKTLAYTDHMALAMACADLIVSRAGASTLAEITALGLPSVLMPYPFDKKKHQLANAKILADYHAAQIVQDTNNPKDNARRLRDALRDLMKSDLRRSKMSQAAAALGRSHAAEDIAAELIDLAKRRS